jgi:hypothetical protein
MTFLWAQQFPGSIWFIPLYDLGLTLRSLIKMGNSLPSEIFGLPLKYPNNQRHLYQEKFNYF